MKGVLRLLSVNNKITVGFYRKMDSDNNNRIVRKVTWVGAVLNVILSAVKIAVGVAASSQALIADGFHSLSDLITDGAVIIGSRFWSEKSDEKHPYGHHRIETMVSLVIALILAVVACGIGLEAISSMQEKHITPPGIAAFFVALISIVSKEILYRWTLKKGKKIGSMALVSNAWHHRSDALSSLPVAIAVAASFYFPDLTYLDHIAAVIVSAMLLKAAFNIAAPCLNQIMDSQGDRHLKEILDELQKSDEKICEFHKIRSRSSGSSIFVDLHMLVDPSMTVLDSHALTKVVEHKLKDHNSRIVDVTIHVEPAKS
jgi:cation diffusion facilitator family transporter